MRDFESRFNAAIHSPVTSELLTHVSQQASRVIPCHPPPAHNNSINNSTSTATATAVATNENESTLIPESANPQAWPPPLRTFISVVVKRSSVRAGTLFATLVFLERLQKRLERVARGMPCTCHRIFLATLIVTSKALHDASPKNKHWAKYAMWCFSLSEINLMEKQLLSILVNNWHCYFFIRCKCMIKKIKQQLIIYPICYRIIDYLFHWTICIMFILVMLRYV